MKVETISSSELALMPTPEGTATHYPVPHSRVRDILVDKISSMGLNFTEEKIQTTHEGNRAIGMIYTEPTDGVRFSAGWINAHDKTSSTKFLAGEEVFICTNGQVFAEFMVRRKHTRGILQEIDNLAQLAVHGFKDAQEINSQRQIAYEQTPLSPLEMRALTVKLAEEKIIASSKIVSVVEEFEKPSFDYQRNMDSIWGLNAATTHILKSISNPIEHQKRTLQLAIALDKFTEFRLAQDFRQNLALVAS